MVARFGSSRKVLTAKSRLRVTSTEELKPQGQEAEPTTRLIFIDGAVVSVSAIHLPANLAFMHFDDSFSFVHDDNCIA